MERDLVGYGKNVPRIEWPGGARIAISLVVNYEEGSEYSTLDGDAHHETNGRPGRGCGQDHEWAHDLAPPPKTRGSACWDPSLEATATPMRLMAPPIATTNRTGEDE